MAVAARGAGVPATADTKRGRILFVAACGSCHTLAAAATKGRKGPNLDEESPGYADTVEQIRNGGGGMPAFRTSLPRAQIANIAAFVAVSARHAHSASTGD